MSSLGLLKECPSIIALTLASEKGAPLGTDGGKKK